MPRQRLHSRQLGGVASRAGASIRGFAYEVMGRMAALARDAGVELLVVGGVLVTRAAIAHARARLGAGRVGVVAADARADLALLRMVRVFVGVAARTSLIGAALNVVRRVAVGAFSVARSMPCAQHRQVFVAGPASDGLVFAELMRLVAPDASHVAACEQCGRGHDRLRLLVTWHARRQRFGPRGVLLLMAGRANLVRSLTLDGVGRLDILMTALARPGLRRSVLMGSVAVEALAGVVDLHGWRERLPSAVAVQAISWRVLVQLPMLGKVLQRLDPGVVAEPMAQRAVALQLCFQARASLGPGVRNFRFFLVTGRAAQGRNRAHVAARDRVAVVARHLLLAYVHLVPVDGARLAPAERDVHTPPGVRGELAVSAGAGQNPQRA